MTAAPQVDLTFACNDSDHVRDLASGAVSPPGIALRTMHFPVEEIFFRFTKFREWDVSELSLGKYVTLRGQGDDSLVGLPVFLSRAFRHSEIFVRADGPRDHPEKLAGGRIGIPEWTVTASVYQRALLAHEYGVDPAAVRWVQGGINEPGRIETLPSALPNGVRVEAERDRSLGDLLLSGQIDAVLVPHPPHAATDGSGRLVPLFTDPRGEEQAYLARTGIFPIMHLAVVRRDVVDRYPWVPRNLMTAFGQAKDNSLRRLVDPTAPALPLPWAASSARHAVDLLGGDPWPYGIDANRTTLDAFLRYAHEQSLTPRLLAVEELFEEDVREKFRV